MEELESVLAIPREEVILASAKEGIGIAEILEAIVTADPAAEGRSGGARSRPSSSTPTTTRTRASSSTSASPQGTLHDHDRIRLMASGAEAELLELGFFRPQLVPGQACCTPARSATSRRASRTSARPRSATRSRPSPPRPREPLPGYQAAKSLVFAGIYPVSGEDYPLLRDAIEKLHLNDASFTFEPESSVALGFGFRCGFLGLLHMEIVQERLEREFDLDLIASAPSVEYQVVLTNGRGIVEVDNPAHLPPVGDIEEIREPWVRLSVVTPSTYIGPLMELSTNRRGELRRPRVHRPASGS